MLQSTGILNKLRDDVMQARPEVPLPRYRVNQPLNLTQLVGSMVIIVVGLLLSIIVFLCEIVQRSAKAQNAKFTYPRIHMKLTNY